MPPMLANGAGKSRLAEGASCGKLCSMSTLTVELPDDLAARLAAESEQRHVPPSQFAREALEKALQELEGKRVFAEMSAIAEADRLTGKHDPELVATAIREHRARRPYR